MHAVALAAMENLMKKEEPLVITIQNVAEFWNVATRPVRNNGLGFTIEEAKTSLARLEGFFGFSARMQRHTRLGKRC